ncbi:hypothetical protein [Romboutsia sp.]|uniref:hypothetical protein n=1 Tax=Romboutsia sp. TaxID=1965302 RepID=UPI003F355FE8
MDNFCKNEDIRLKEFEDKLEAEKKKIDKEKFYYDKYEKRVMYSSDIKTIKEDVFELKPVYKPQYTFQKIAMIGAVIIIAVFIFINK